MGFGPCAEPDGGGGRLLGARASLSCLLAISLGATLKEAPDGGGGGGVPEGGGPEKDKPDGGGPGGTSPVWKGRGASPLC